MQICFEKYLQPQQAKQKEKKTNNYDDERNTKVKYFKFLCIVLANKYTGANVELSLAQTSEAFHSYWEYEPPTIKSCHLYY